MPQPFTTFRSRVLATLCVSAVCGAVQAAAPIELVAITSPADLAPTVATSNLAKECDIGKMTGERVMEQLSRAHPKMAAAAALPALSGDQRGLSLTVVNMFGLGGGGWSGPKWMVVRAELIGPDGVVSTQEFRRVTAASFMGIVSGTCPLMGKVASAAGQDIRNWLKKGAPNAAPNQAPSGDPAPAEPAASQPAAPADNAASSAS